jgi:hypothetical protein
MNQIAVTFSVRVAFAQHTPAQTLTLPVVALRDPIAQTGAILTPAPEFIDPGYGGVTFNRPALERRPAAVAASGIEPAAVYSPDRLAYQAADQGRDGVGCQRAGMKLLCLNRPGGDGWEPADAPRLPWRYRSPRPSPLTVTVTAPLPAVTPRRPL